MKQASKMGVRQFMFFVPGRSPGTGSWFVAPMHMLKNARKIRNPAFIRRR